MREKGDEVWLLTQWRPSPPSGFVLSYVDAETLTQHGAAVCRRAPLKGIESAVYSTRLTKNTLEIESPEADDCLKQKKSLRGYIHIYRGSSIES